MKNTAVVGEIRSMHERYEAALMANDTAVLNGFFWQSPEAVRFGAGENLYGHADIAAFRAARSTVDLRRQVSGLRIVALDNANAVVTLEFQRHIAGTERKGRQTQVWHKFEEGWKIVSAHVSLLAPAGGYMGLAAEQVGLAIPEQFGPGVQANLERAAVIAQPLLAFPLGEEIEAAPVFQP